MELVIFDAAPVRGRGRPRHTWAIGFYPGLRSGAGLFRSCGAGFWGAYQFHGSRNLRKKEKAGPSTTDADSQANRHPPLGMTILGGMHGLKPCPSQFTGYPSPTLSHRTQKEWGTRQTADPLRLRSGQALDCRMTIRKRIGTLPLRLRSGLGLRPRLVRDDKKWKGRGDMHFSRKRREMGHPEPGGLPRLLFFTIRMRTQASNCLGRVL